MPDALDINELLLPDEMKDVLDRKPPVFQFFRILHQDRPALSSIRNVNVNDLFPQTRGREVLMSLAYPSYTSEEARDHSNNPLWYRLRKTNLFNRDIGSRAQVLTPEEGGVALIHESTGKADRLQDYLSELIGYRTRFETYADNYRERLRELCEGRLLVSSAPLISEIIGGEIEHAVDPYLVAHANNKDNLDDIVPREHAPKRKTGLELDPEEVLSFIGPSEASYPIVLKGDGVSSSGDTVRMVDVNDPKEVERALRELADKKCETVIVEEYFQHTDNFSVQFVVDEHSIKFFGFSKQLIKPGTSIYRGSVYKLRDAREPTALPEDVWKAAHGTAEKLQHLGYRGVVSMDILFDEETQKACVVDPNVRMTASTPALAMIPKIFDVSGGAEEMELIKVRTRTDINALMKTLGPELERGEVVALGAAVDGETTQGYLAVPGDQDQRSSMRISLNGKGLQIP